MVFGREFSEKLTHLMVATAICCATASATVVPAPTAIGLVEALLGGAALAHFVLGRRFAKADALVRRCARQMESGSDAWLETEFRDDPDAGIKRDVAIAAIRGVVALIVPKPEELVGARLSEDRVAAFYLDRAAKVRPGVFGDNADNTIARRLLRSVVANAYRLIVRQPEFAAEVLHHSLAELLTGQDEIMQSQGEIRRDLEHLPDAIVSRLVAALDARGETRRAEDAGLERDTIIKIARRLRPDEMLDFDQAVVELEGAVDVALDAVARGERGTNHDDFADLVLARVAEKTKLGDFDGGVRAVDEALVELDRRETEQRGAFRRSRVAILEAGLGQDILSRDPAGAARRIEAIVVVEQPDDRPAWSPAYRERFDHFYEEGETKGINFSLSVAIELARSMVASAGSADERGMAGNLLGLALWRLGERESGTARLEEAVAAYRAALEEYTRERVPLDWATIQNNLGNALSGLGARESGTARLEEAVAAYRAALAEHTRDRVPLLWATTQNNLGNALSRLGARESGTARLEEAVMAYRAALEEYTRERVPLDWAMTQNNLGLALGTLGERESGTARLEEAVMAYRAALEEYTRERVPLDWATTQNNLGNALSGLGARESGTARLEEAVMAYRAALAEHTRDRVPLLWATTQNNLGTALQTLGARESGTARLEEAVMAYRAALEERTRDRVPLDWAGTQNNLGNALRTLGARESGTARLEQAVAAYRAALAEYTRDRVPLDWAGAQNNLGNALRTLGARESGTARLEEAVAAYRAALEERTRDRVPLDWAGTQNNLGNALGTLGARESGTARLAEAVMAYRAALEEYTRDRVPLDWAMSTGNQGVALMLLAERLGDPARARAAVEQIEIALATMRAGGHVPFAALYEAQLPRARALRDRLAGG